MKERVRPFGIGQLRILIDLDELPQDIVYGIIKRTAHYKEDDRITKNTKSIAIIGSIFSNDKL